MSQILRILTLFFCIAASFADKKIPDGLMLGVGSAAYQIEGGWDADGKGPSMWDEFLHEKGGPNGDIAADSYHKWQEDVDNIKKLGVDFYRFSISWSRILPNGTLNSINQAGVDYYLNLIKGLKAAGVEPVITLYHWDMPEHISLEGGLLNTQFVDYFEDYVRLCYQLYGSYVKYWLTFNDPYEICRSGYGGINSAPGLNLFGDGLYQCSYVLLKAHARAYRIYDEEFRSQYNGQISIVITTDYKEPWSVEPYALEALEREIQFSCGWFGNPIFKGNWPQLMIDRIGDRSKLEGLSRSRLPEFTQEEIAYIKGTHDFFALNIYSGIYVLSYPQDSPISYPNYDFDLDVYSTFHNESDPSALRFTLNVIDSSYSPKAIMITGNGYRSDDKIEDPDRIEYIRDHLSNLIDTITEDKINVIGYSVWSLTDHFEWGTYDTKFGLIHVDFDSPNRTRTWKDSARWYQNVTATRILVV